MAEGPKKNKDKNKDDKKVPKIKVEKTKRQKILELVNLAAYGTIGVSTFLTGRHLEATFHHHFLPSSEQVGVKPIELAKAGKISEAKESCATDNSNYRFNSSVNAQDETPVLTDQEFEQFKSGVELDNNITLNILRDKLNAFQYKTGISLEMVVINNKKLKASDLLLKLATFQAITQSYNGTRNISTFLIHTDRIKMDNNITAAADGYFNQNGGRPILALDLEHKLDDILMTSTHEIHHYNPNRNQTVNLCKLLIDMETSGLTDKEIENVFEKIKRLDSNPEILALKIKDQIMDKKLSISFESKTRDTDVDRVLDGILKKEIFGDKKVGLRNYYIYSTVLNSVMKSLILAHSQLSETQKDVLNIPAKHTYEILNETDGIDNIVKNSEITTVSSELQVKYPNISNYKEFVDSLMISSAVFNNGALLDRQYIEMRLMFIKMSGEISFTQDIEFKTFLTNQLLTFSAKMNDYLVTNQRPFDINQFMKVKGPLVDFLKSDISRIERDFYANKTISTVINYQDVKDFNRIDMLTSNSIDINNNNLKEFFTPEDQQAALEVFNNFKTQIQNKNVNIKINNNTNTKISLLDLQKFLTQLKISNKLNNAIVKNYQLDIYLGYDKSFDYSYTLENSQVSLDKHFIGVSLSPNDNKRAEANSDLYHTTQQFTKSIERNDIKYKNLERLNDAIYFTQLSEGVRMNFTQALASGKKQEGGMGKSQQNFFQNRIYGNIDINNKSIGNKKQKDNLFPKTINEQAYGYIYNAIYEDNLNLLDPGYITLRVALKRNINRVDSITNTEELKKLDKLIGDQQLLLGIMNSKKTPFSFDQLGPRYEQIVSLLIAKK